ncbi:MAG: hypothetical protein VXY81_15050, partial [Pseudomonadota bacterium]|nr:hypothetical protein [Pseudomonadota bacterium]
APSVCGQVNAKSVALPAISAGARGFPVHLAACISAAVACSEVLASGGDLRVYLVAYAQDGLADALRNELVGLGVSVHIAYP